MARGIHAITHSACFNRPLTGLYRLIKRTSRSKEKFFPLMRFSRSTRRVTCIATEIKKRCIVVAERRAFPRAFPADEGSNLGDNIAVVVALQCFAVPRCNFSLGPIPFARRRRRWRFALSRLPNDALRGAINFLLFSSLSLSFCLSFRYLSFLQLRLAAIINR